MVIKIVTLLSERLFCFMNFDFFFCILLNGYAIMNSCDKIFLGECTVMGVPNVSTKFSGFGKFLSAEFYGINVNN